MPMFTRIMPTLAVVSLMLLALIVSGCSIPLGESKPSVTLTTHYVASSPTPMPCPTPAPSPTTSWNGIYVKLHGNISAGMGEHVYGMVKIYYLDRNYWEEHPNAQYDTDAGGAYSLDVRANVPFKVEVGYLYVGQLPEVMIFKRPDMVYTIEEDTPLDFEVMTSSITPIY
jgi:hypothetical protein